MSIYSRCVAEEGERFDTMQGARCFYGLRRLTVEIRGALSGVVGRRRALSAGWLGCPRWVAGCGPATPRRRGVAEVDGCAGPRDHYHHIAHFNADVATMGTSFGHGVAPAAPPYDVYRLGVPLRGDPGYAVVCWAHAADSAGAYDAYHYGSGAWGLKVRTRMNNVE